MVKESKTINQNSNYHKSSYFEYYNDKDKNNATVGFE